MLIDEVQRVPDLWLAIKNAVDRDPRPGRFLLTGDRDQYEVDALLEDNAGRVVGVGVKAAETVRADDFRGLRILRDRLGPRFHAGVVLYCGSESLSFGDRLACLPISALWTTAG